jgi:ABC-type uncharacterized transport system auxiliary subunit
MIATFIRLACLPALGALLILSAACLPSARPAITTNYYIFDYSSPEFTRQSLPAGLRVERFTSSQEFNSQDMIFSPRPGVRQNYNYSRWRVYPAEMCFDYLIRDLWASAIVRVVTASALSRFRLEGSVEEMLRLDYDGSGSAVRLALNCSLFDSAASGGLPQKLLFQRAYQAEQPVEDDSPLAMSLALSQAMKDLSQSLQEDIYQAIKERLAEEE